jgi:hypothetical protein
MLGWLSLLCLAEPVGESVQKRCSVKEHLVRIEKRHANTRVCNLRDLAFADFLSFSFVVWKILQGQAEKKSHRAEGACSEKDRQDYLSDSDHWEFSFGE